MVVYSVVEHDVDIISQCLEDIQEGGFTDLKKKEIPKKCLDKIMATMQFFKENAMIPDGIYCKSLEGNIIEFRIQLPKSKHLLRIFAGYRSRELVLITSYLIKPQQYQDSHTTSVIDTEYNKKITQAKLYRNDFQGKQTFIYSKLHLNLKGFIQGSS